MQVRVGPAKGPLQHGVQLGQFDRRRDEQAAPDGRPDIEQGDLQLQLDVGGIELGASLGHGKREVARVPCVGLPQGRV